MPPSEYFKRNCWVSVEADEEPVPITRQIEGLPPAENRSAATERPAPVAAPEAAPPPEPKPAQPAEASSPYPEAPRPTPDWSSTPSRQAPEPAMEERAQPDHEWKTSSPDWAAPAEAAAAPGSTPPPPEIREDLQSEIAQRMGGFGPVPEPPAPGVEVPPAVDDRLSSLSGLFAPGPAANAPQPQAPAPAAKPPPGEPKDWWRAPGGGRPAESRRPMPTPVRRAPRSASPAQGYDPPA